MAIQVAHAGQASSDAICPGESTDTTKSGPSNHATTGILEQNPQTADARMSYMIVGRISGIKDQIVALAEADCRPPSRVSQAG
jgi:hypothetical protein